MDASRTEIIDRELALERAGGNAELAEELLRLLVQELPLQQERLEAAHTAGDLDQIRDIAHKIKGSATYCATPALLTAAATLEGHLKRGETAHADEELSALLHEIRRLLDAVT